MNVADKARTITAVRSTGEASIVLTWSDGTNVTLDLTPMIANFAFASCAIWLGSLRSQPAIWGIA